MAPTTKEAQRAELHKTIWRIANDEVLSERQMQDYQSIYLDLYADFRRELDSDRESINDDVVFEIELIKQVEVNVDYVLMLVAKWRAEHGDGDDRELRASISRAIDASPSLRNKKDLIEAFVDALSADGRVDEQWQTFIGARQAEELDRIIQEEGLKPDETRAFIETAFRDGTIQGSGTPITRILPRPSRASPRVARTASRSSESWPGSAPTSSGSSALASAVPRWIASDRARR